MENIDSMNKLIQDVKILINKHIKDNRKGYTETVINVEYMFGRLEESREFKRDFDRLLQEYYYMKG